MTSHRPLRSRRTRAAVAATGLAAALVLAGCSATNPIQTQDQYDASDGVSVRLGDVRASNLLIVSAGEGEEGVLLGGLTNTGKEDATVTVTFAAPGEGADAAPAADPTTIDVPARSTVLLTGSAGSEADDTTVDVRVAQTPAAPGGVAVVGVDVDIAGSQTVQVPVLDGTLPDYAPLLPTAP
ncbi:hypothetical protein [Cellulomonas palmilytica]|uniref:hypothetical protein n=1 Tax=Cellulomonas palmilytica TaxID=2608402 RepID=UPI001F2C893B|nr:hypothetical protein [Cellulomonas palmilytica]UJP40932.1 hypothetical protein F1D97_05535 [Cellulomonas palmilytica]